MRFFFSLAGLFISVAVSAQFTSLGLERYTVNEGLSNPSVNSILQTRDGFLWIATKDGLNRFDGQFFRVFKKSQSDSLSLPENYVMCLLEDREGTLWVGTWGGGLCRYDQSHEMFVPLNLPESGDDYVQCLYEDQKGILWFGTTKGGVYRVEKTSLKPVSLLNSFYRSEPGFHPNCTVLTGGENQDIWIGTFGGGIFQFNPDSGKIRQITAGLSDLRINDIFRLPDQSGLLISTESGISQLDFSTGKIHRPNLPGSAESVFYQNSVRQSLMDSRGRLWVGTFYYQGLFLFENPFTENAKTIYFEHEEGNAKSLSSNQIRWIYEDRNHHIWIGTEDGLNKLPSVKPFIQYRHQSGNPGSLQGRVLSGIGKSAEGDIWVSYRGSGFDRIQEKTGKIVHFRSDPGKTNTLSDGDVTTLFIDASGKIWLGTMNQGLNEFDPVTQKFRHFTRNTGQKNTLASNWIQKVLETRSGFFLVGSNDGLQILDRKSGSLISFREFFNLKPEQIPDVFSVNELAEDKNGTIWIGTWLDGLFGYNPVSRKFYRFMPDPANPSSLSASKVSVITSDSKGFLWIGTHSGGLNRLDPETGIFTHYSTQNGLPNDVVFSVFEDKKYQFWIGTLNGLAKLDPSTGKIRVYTETDGLVSNQFNWHAGYQDLSGLIYIGGINGFVIFDPQKIEAGTTPPQVALTSFKIFETEANLPQSLPATQKILLRYNQNFFSLDFVALDMAPVTSHSYRYKLEGIDPEWVSAGNRNTAFYTDIKPGQYRFWVMAGNSEGIWSEPAGLSVEILPAWWMTWWFKSILGFLFIALVWNLYRYRVRQVMKVERIRMDIASDLHDEIGSNLSSISVDSYVLMRNPDLTPAERELTKDISRTAQKTIESMRDIVWFINPKNEQGTDLLLKFKAVAVTLLNTLEWTFTASPDIDLGEYSMEIRKNLYLIYKESLTNIVKHSGATKVEIKLSRTPLGLKMSVADNGTGFDSDHQFSGNGIRNMKNRAAKIGAAIEISGKADGTTISVTLKS